MKRHPEASGVFADSSALALAATRATLHDAGLEADVTPSDGFSDVTGRFDLVLSNPPFHVGHRERKELSPELFAPLGNFLVPGGQCIMVANRHLPYRAWLDQGIG